MRPGRGARALGWLTPQALAAGAFIPADRREELYPDVRLTTEADSVVFDLFHAALPWVFS